MTRRPAIHSVGVATYFRAWQTAATWALRIRALTCFALGLPFVLFRICELATKATERLPSAEDAANTR